MQRNRGLARFLKQDIYRGGGGYIKWSNTNVLISPGIFCKNAQFRSKNNKGGGEEEGVYLYAGL